MADVTFISSVVVPLAKRLAVLLSRMYVAFTIVELDIVGSVVVSGVVIVEGVVVVKVG